MPREVGSFATIGRVLHVLALALWTGGGLALMLVVTPLAFGVLPDRTDATVLVSAVLARLDLFGVVAGPLILLSLFAGYAQPRVRLRFRALGAAVMTGLTALSGLWLSPRIAEVHAALARPLEDLPTNDPMRVELGNLHTASEAILLVHVALAVALLLSAVIGASPRRPSLGIEL